MSRLFLRAVTVENDRPGSDAVLEDEKTDHWENEEGGEKDGFGIIDA